MYLGCRVCACGSVTDETILRTLKAKAACINLSNYWCLCDVSLFVKGRVYNASMRTVLLCAFKT